MVLQFVDVKRHVQLHHDVQLCEFEFVQFGLQQQLNELQLVYRLGFQEKFLRKEDLREMRQQSTSFLLSLFKFDKPKNKISD